MAPVEKGTPMPHTERGHEHEGRDAVITINESLVDRLDERALAGLVDALIAAYDSRADETRTTSELQARMADLGIEQPETVVQRIVENLRHATRPAIVTDAGRVLHGNPAWTPAQHDPDVRSTEDPEHPDRPLYS